MRVYDLAGGFKGRNNLESSEFKKCDRIQIDYGTSGATSVEVMARLDKDAEWVSQLGVVTATDTSEMLIIPVMPYQKLVFVGGNGTQLAYAESIDGAYE